MDFNTENREHWIKILNNIFSNSIPNYFEWTDLSEIILVLNAIGSIPNSNHMFYPKGGGMDIRSAKSANEANCIEIYTGLTDILKPKKLSFESFEDPIWNYFRIETLPLSPSETSEASASEELIELEPGRYIARTYWDEGEYLGRKLPLAARPLTRHLMGSFVIFAKSSPYNRHSSTYDARHNSMGADEFRTYIEKVIKHGWQDR